MKRFLSLFVSALCAVCAWAQNLENGHEYVDLGLTSRTLWATCNVGAENPEDAGDYYAWGETETHYSAGGNTDTPTWKEGYSAGYGWSTYKWCNGSPDAQTKYCTSSSSGTVDDKIELEDADDVAVQTWGGSWKMPTMAQLDELRNECDWEWTSINGVNGYKVKSRVNSNFIFLPAAGLRSETNLFDAGDGGYYWSRSLNADDSDLAYSLYFLSSFVDGDSGSRCLGLSVRPVCVPAPIAQITIGEETTKYYDVEEFLIALGAITSKATLTLLGDITLPDNVSLSINGPDITLDLNGHNIKSYYPSRDAIYTGYYTKLTIEGEGIVENTGEGGDAISTTRTVVIKNGTYKSEYVCYVNFGFELTINGGKFKANKLYVNGSAKPIIKGGLFSMDPSECVAEGYEAVANDDEETKGDYPYKVVEKSLIPTAIEGVDAPAAQKAVKTIENGKVVIIRGDKKYDLSGREL